MDQPGASVIAVTGTVDKHVPLPVVPLYDLSLAAELIPCTVVALRKHLSTFKGDYPPIYRRERCGRKVRLLTAREIAKIRSRMLRGPGVSRVLDVYPALQS